MTWRRNNPEVMKKLLAYAGKAREELGDDLTHHQGSDRREPGRITGESGIYPSSPAFPKAFKDKYRPGLKARVETALPR